MALLSGQHDCTKEKFLYVQDPDCFWERRCHSVKERRYGNDSTLCLVRLSNV